MDGRLYSASYSYGSGGVGRNICEALHKMGCPPLFISAVGDDYPGNILIKTIPESCQRGVKLVKNHDSGQCHVVLYSNGSCPFLLGNMSIHAEITPEFVSSFEEEIKKAPLLIIDGNLSVETLETVMMFGEKFNIPVFFEPTDISVIEKVFKVKNMHISYITPNIGELTYLINYLNLKIAESSANKLVEVALMAKALTKYFPVVMATMDELGVMVVSRSSPTDPLLTAGKNYHEGEVKARHYPIQPMKKIVSVSGAGDCFASGVIMAMLEGLSEEVCMSVGFQAAKSSLLSSHAVPDRMFGRNHICWMEAAKFTNII